MILPEDPDINQPLLMGDPYQKSLTPKLAQAKRNAEFDEQRNQEIMKTGRVPYANSAAAYAPDPWIKSAQAAGVSNLMTQPMWFSPIHTPQSWQTASRRREVYQWMKTDQSEILVDDFTFKKIYDLEFNGEAIQDSVTGGILFECNSAEKVISGQGQYRSPSRVSFRECNKKRCFEIKCYGYWRSDSSSEEHKSLILNGDSYRKYKKSCSDAKYRDRSKPCVGKMLEWKQACEISTNDYLLAPISKVGNESISSSLSWMIGLFLADGTSYKGDGYSIRFTMDRREKHRELLETKLKEYGWHVSSVPHYSQNGWRVSVSRKEAYELFTKYVVGKGLNKKLSAEIFKADRETRLNLLGGYFDGDGSFSNKDGKVVANCYSCDMADQVYWLLLSVGIRASLGRYPLYGDHYETNAKWCYRVFIPQSDVLKLKPYMRSEKIPDDFIPRKTRELRFFYEEDGIKYLAQPIESIKQFSYTGCGYDLQIDPERSFVASGFVTSNCRHFYENEPKVAAAIDFYCFTPQMQVLMSDGSQKSISSISPGDSVRSHDGTTNVVNKVFKRQAKEEILKIKISGIATGTMRTTYGHRLLVAKKGSEPKFIAAEELRVGDYLLTPCLYDNTEGRKGLTVDNDFAWLLGMYAAEGCGIPYEHADKDGKLEQHFQGVYFTLSYEEKDTLALEISNKIRNIYGTNNIHIRSNKDKGICRVAAYGRNIADDLHGLCPGTSKFGTKRFAPCVMKWHPENLLYVLGGFFSGDGCFNKNNGFQGVGVSKKLCEQVANILDIHGLEYSYRATRIDKGNRQVCYNVRISRRACDKLETVSHKINYNKNSINTSKIHNTPYFRQGNYIYRKVTKITPMKYEGILYDLEIDKAHSYVVNRVAVHNSKFSMNGFELECPNRKILSFFKHHVVDRLDLNEKFKMISSEYFMLGDVFIHLDVNCPVCSGSAVDPETGELCNHPGGKWNRLVILNPDWIEVQQSVLSDEPSIVLIPDEELKRIVFYKQPKAIYDRLPDKVKEYVIQNKPIPLSNRVTSHIRHMPVPYGTYGTSLIRRLFTTLAYKTKIMTANWIIAERLILPVRVVKLGSDANPATSADIADIQQQLGATANDPNLTIVTHHSFEYEWYGACFDSNTEILTQYGWRRFSDIDKNDIVATYNKQTSALEFQQIQKKHEHDFVSNDKLKMIHFTQRGVDIMVTPEHRMLVERNGKLQTVMSQNVKHRDKFVSSINWKGTIPDRLPFRDSPLSHLSLDEYLKFSGYYISEGGSKRELSKGLSKDKQIQAAGISQNIDSSCYDDIECLVKKVYPSYSLHNDDRRKIPTHTFVINNVEIARYLSNEFGTGAREKYIPTWIKNLPVDKLKIFYDALMAGDGDIRDDRYKPRYRYTTISKRLADDFSEICLKMGYWPNTCLEKLSHKNINHSDIYRIYWSEDRVNRKFTLNIDNVHNEDYNGKVYCVTVENGFIITRRNGKITIQGNSGKILQVTQEMEFVGKEILDGFMLNQSLLNGEMPGYCHSSDTLTLTDSGFKRYDEIDENDRIACYNSKLNRLEYHKYIKKHVYNYSGEMVQFNTDKIDILVTPNHRMWSAKRDSNKFIFVEAKDIKPRARFLGTVDNYKNTNNSDGIKIGENFYGIKDYCEIVGYYVSEGFTAEEKRPTRTRQTTTLHISQTPKGNAIKNIAEMFNRCFKTHYFSDSCFSVYNPSLAQHLKLNYGDHSTNKRLNKFVKNLSTENLEILLESLMLGDGSIRTYVDRKTDSYTYYTSSYQLALDVAEISFKCGYATKISKYSSNRKKKYFNQNGFEIKTKHPQWVVHISKGFKGKKPTLSSKSRKYKNKEITKTHYDGLVYCFTVPTGLFVTMRNGKITIQGNSSAQVGVETLIRRIESWRQTLEEWCEKNVFKPVAEMQGFIDHEKTEEIGEPCFLYPTIKWNDLNLKDKTQWYQLLTQLHDKQVISTQTLMEEMDLNYDQEVKRMRYEVSQGGTLGMAGGMGGGAGGMGGMGMGGGLGGGGMGGGEPGMDNAGGMGPAGAGLGGMAPGGGGMTPGPGAAGIGTGASSGGKIMKKGKSKQQEEVSPEEMAAAMPMVKLTEIEQKMAEMLIDVADANQVNRNNIRVQFPIENPNGGKHYTLDFAIPHLKMGVETDGEAFHDQPDQMESDQERDHLLAQRGWTILRFDDKVIYDAPQEIKSTISTFIKKLQEKTQTHQKTSEKIAGKEDIHLFSSRNGRLVDFGINYPIYEQGIAMYRS